MAKDKTDKFKVNPSLFKQMVKARHQNVARAQHASSLQRPREEIPHTLSPIVRTSTSSVSPPVPRKTGNTQWYVPLPSNDEEIPVDEDNRWARLDDDDDSYWARFREDYEAASEMSEWDTNQRAIEIAEMDESEGATSTAVIM